MTLISFGKLHRPRFYRYGVADRRVFHPVLNTYSGMVCRGGRKNVIGAGVVLGRYAYCVKWAKPTISSRLKGTGA